MCFLIVNDTYLETMSATTLPSNESEAGLDKSLNSESNNNSKVSASSVKRSACHTEGSQVSVIRPRKSARLNLIHKSQSKDGAQDKIRPRSNCSHPPIKLQAGSTKSMDFKVNDKRKIVGIPSSSGLNKSEKEGCQPSVIQENGIGITSVSNTPSAYGERYDTTANTNCPQSIKSEVEWNESSDVKLNDNSETPGTTSPNIQYTESETEVFQPSIIHQEKCTSINPVPNSPNKNSGRYKTLANQNCSKPSIKPRDELNEIHYFELNENSTNMQSEPKDRQQSATQALQIAVEKFKRSDPNDSAQTFGNFIASHLRGIPIRKSKLIQRKLTRTLFDMLDE